jgi:DNA-binding transcriptional regulator YdaS (Cro superfamily)
MTEGLGRHCKLFLEYEEVLELLRSEIALAGSQVHWANRMGVARSKLNKALRGATVLSKPAIRALKLRVVYAPISETEMAAPVRPTVTLEHEDVMRLLRSEIERAGSQLAWAKREGVSRPEVNKMLGWSRPISKTVIKALKLRIVYVRDHPEGGVVARGAQRMLRETAASASKARR